jgi:NADH-quinone oxidoreductase subunit M
MYAALAWFAIALPLAAGWLVPAHLQSARRIGYVLLAGFAAVLALVGLHLAVPGHAPIGGGLLLTGVRAAVLPITALLPALLLIGRPGHMERGELRGFVAMHAGHLLVVFAADLRLVVVGWSLGALPVLLHARHEPSRGVRRASSFLAAGMLAPLVLAVAWAGMRLPTGFAVVQSTGMGASSDQLAIATLLLVAAGTRTALAPFHGWLPVLLERGPRSLALLSIATPLGAFLVVGIALPLVPDGLVRWLDLLVWGGVVSALYGAVLALVQRNLWRALGFITVSQAGLGAIGLGTLTVHGITGAMVSAIALSIARVGLGVLAWAAEARVGALDLGTHRGLVRSAPVLTGLFLLFVLASEGLSFTPSPLADELVALAILPHHPVAGALGLLAAGVGAVALVRAFQRTFLGPPPPATERPAPDLTTRERATAFALVAVTLLLGIHPPLLIDTIHDSVTRVARVRLH